MATIKKVVAMSGNEYQKLKNKAAAYDAIIAKQLIENSDELNVNIEEEIAEKELETTT